MSTFLSRVHMANIMTRAGSVSLSKG